MTDHRVDRDMFRAAMLDRFPGVAARILPEDDGLVCLQMSAFCDFTQAAIDSGDFRLVEQCFQFADSLFLNGDDEVKNAIRVSFIEHVNFDGDWGDGAQQLMPASLHSEWVAIKRSSGIDP